MGGKRKSFFVLWAIILGLQLKIWGQRFEVLKKAAAEAGNKELKKKASKQAINHSGKPLFKQPHRTAA